MKGKQNAASLNQPKKPQKKSGFQRDSESKQEEELEAALLQKYNKLAKKNYKKALKIVQSRHQDDFEDFPYDLGELSDEDEFNYAYDPGARSTGELAGDFKKAGPTMFNPRGPNHTGFKPVRSIDIKYTVLELNYRLKNGKESYSMEEILQYLINDDYLDQGTISLLVLKETLMDHPFSVSNEEQATLMARYLVTDAENEMIESLNIEQEVEYVLSVFKHLIGVDTFEEAYQLYNTGVAELLERKRISFENFFFEKQKNVQFHTFQQVEDLIHHFNIELSEQELRYLGWLLFRKTNDFSRLPFPEVFKLLHEKIELKKKKEAKHKSEGKISLSKYIKLFKEEELKFLDKSLEELKGQSHESVKNEFPNITSDRQEAYLLDLELNLFKRMREHMLSHPEFTLIENSFRSKWIREEINKEYLSKEFITRKKFSIFIRDHIDTTKPIAQQGREALVALEDRYKEKMNTQMLQSKKEKYFGILSFIKIMQMIAKDNDMQIVFLEKRDPLFSTKLSFLNNNRYMITVEVKHPNYPTVTTSKKELILFILKFKRCLASALDIPSTNISIFRIFKDVSDDDIKMELILLNDSVADFSTSKEIMETYGKIRCFQSRLPKFFILSKEMFKNTWKLYSTPNPTYKYNEYCDMYNFSPKRDWHRIKLPFVSFARCFDTVYHWEDGRIYDEEIKPDEKDIFEENEEEEEMAKAAAEMKEEERQTKVFESDDVKDWVRGFQSYSKFMGFIQENYLGIDTYLGTFMQRVKCSKIPSLLEDVSRNSRYLGELEIEQSYGAFQSEIKDSEEGYEEFIFSPNETDPNFQVIPDLVRSQYSKLFKIGDSLFRVMVGFQLEPSSIRIPICSRYYYFVSNFMAIVPTHIYFKPISESERINASSRYNKIGQYLVPPFENQYNKALQILMKALMHFNNRETQEEEEALRMKIETEIRSRLSFLGHKLFSKDWPSGNNPSNYRGPMIYIKPPKGTIRLGIDVSNYKTNVWRRAMSKTGVAGTEWCVGYVPLNLKYSNLFQYDKENCHIFTDEKSCERTFRDQERFGNFFEDKDDENMYTFWYQIRMDPSIVPQDIKRFGIPKNTTTKMFHLLYGILICRYP